MSKAKKLRIGVVGLGRIGWHGHCRALKSHRDFALAAVSDVSEARCREAEAELGCPAFQDYAEMLDRADLEAVVIASPTHLHKSMALAAFRKGLHVLLEKPMALDLAEARSITRAARQAGLVLTVYQPHRLCAYFQHLLRIVKSGRLGTVYQVRRGMFNLARRNDWQSLKKFGGGMLSNYGAHALDQTLAITGPNVARVFCSLRRVASLGDTDDVVKVVYETRDGNVGELDINQALTASPYHFEVYGTHGTAVLSPDRASWVVRWFDPRTLGDKQLDRGLAAADRRYPSDKIDVQEESVPVNARCGVDVYKDFARAVRTGGEPFVPPEETVAVMKLIEQCRKEAGRTRSTPM